MEYRELGKTGLRVSPIGVGAWQLGGPLVLDGKADGHPEAGREFCIDLIRRCGEMGINFIDTAEQYGDGESERRVGEAIKGHRQDWIVSTKFGNQVGPGGRRLRDASPRRVPISLEGSLRRLGTDCIDVYLYHIAPVPGEAEEVAGILEAARKKGQVRFVGISTPDVQQARYLHSLGCLDVVQFPRSMIGPADDMVAFLAGHGLGGVVRGALAGGRLSGKYFHRPPEFGDDDVRRTRFGGEGQNLAVDWARYAVFEELLSPARSMVQLALRYLLDDPTTHTIIPGGKSEADYRQAIASAELPALTPAEHERIAQLRTQLSAKREVK